MDFARRQRVASVEDALRLPEAYVQVALIPSLLHTLIGRLLVTSPQIIVETFEQYKTASMCRLKREQLHRPKISCDTPAKRIRTANS